MDEDEDDDDDEWWMMFKFNWVIYIIRITL